MSKKLISIVIPAYNEEDCVDELCRRLGMVFDEEPKYNFECIIVENGSQDRTYELLRANHTRDDRIKVLRLARNFGADGGITAGLSEATGDACVIMMADLQDPPEVIHEFIREWEMGYENIYALITERGGTSALRRFNSKLFYKVAGTLTKDRIARDASDFRLADRKVYETVRNMNERNRFVRGLFSWVGFRSKGIPVNRPPRHGGRSHAHTLGVLDLAFKGIFAHSYVPLRAISLVGICMAAVSVVLFLVSAIMFVIAGVPFNGFGTLVTILLLGFGLIALLLGVIGEYVGLIYEEVKARPIFVIAEKLGLDSQPQPRP